MSLETGDPRLGGPHSEQKRKGNGLWPDPMLWLIRSPVMCEDSRDKTCLVSLQAGYRITLGLCFLRYCIRIKISPFPRESSALLNIHRMCI